MNEKGSILVVGGGISGMTAALEASESGRKVILVEKEPYLGGRVARTNKYFPKLCPPTCGLEINFKRLRQNPDIKVYTLSEVESISGEKGNYKVSIKINPRYVDDRSATTKCVEDCPVEIDNELNYNMDKIKAVRLPHEMAYPMKLIADKEALEKVKDSEEYKKFTSECEKKGITINLEDKPETIEVNVGSIVWATGWKPYDATKLDNLGFGKYKDVINNVIIERLASQNGPTGGQIVRPSDNKKVDSVAFVQCAGSRDENYLPYCSGVCCLASLKQATYIREQNPDAKIYIFYIDLRSHGRFEEFYNRVQKDENIILIKGKIAKVMEDPQTKDLIVEGENTDTGEKVGTKVDMVVLATGIVPNTKDEPSPVDATYDEFGFMIEDEAKPGIHPAGCVKKPMDVGSSLSDATSAALKALIDTV
jgi:quinone-modifying oxidoreductase subunit QmoA